MTVLRITGEPTLRNSIKVKPASFLSHKAILKSFRGCIEIWCNFPKVAILCSSLFSGSTIFNAARLRILKEGSGGISLVEESSGFRAGITGCVL